MGRGGGDRESRRARSEGGLDPQDVLYGELGPRIHQPSVPNPQTEEFREQLLVLAGMELATVQTQENYLIELFRIAGELESSPDADDLKSRLLEPRNDPEENSATSRRIFSEYRATTGAQLMTMMQLIGSVEGLRTWILQAHGGGRQRIEDELDKILDEARVPLTSQLLVEAEKYVLAPSA